MYIITGATGNIGKAIATELLLNGKKIRVISRDVNKLKGLVEKGAEPMEGDLKDPDFVNKAFAGVSAAFLIIPPNNHSTDFRSEQNIIAKNYLHAVKTNHLSHVVLLSSIGAHLRNGAGIIDGLGEMEELFKEVKEVNVLNLRPSYFMENVYGQLHTIKFMGIMGSPVKGDLSFPIVATKDIAAVVAQRLLTLKFTGNTIEYVLGERDLSYNEIAKVIGLAIGRPDLKYVMFPYEDAAKAMVQAGFVSENVAGLLNGLARAMNDGSALNAYQRTPENSTPTTIEDFSKNFAAIFDKS